MATYNEEVKAANASIQGAAALVGTAGDMSGAAKSDLEKGRGDFSGNALLGVESLGKTIMQLLIETTQGAQTAALQAKGALAAGQALLNGERSNPEAALTAAFQEQDAQLDGVVAAIANLLGNTTEIAGALAAVTTALNNKAKEFGHAAETAAAAQRQAYALREAAENTTVR